MTVGIDTAGHWDRLAERLRDANTRIADIAETAESDDGLVTATVDARGRLTALEIDPRVYRNPDSGALAERILGAVRVATERTDRQVLETAVDSDVVARADSGRPSSLLRELDRLVPGGRPD